MKRKNLIWITGLLFGFTSIFFQSCNDESDDPTGKGEVEFKMTDAPSDDAEIKGVFVTVTDIKVDGKSVEGFNKQTIDLKAYQKGQAKLLGTSELDAKTYNNLTLVLDLDTDASGNQPGCYVLTQDEVKYKLKSTADGTASIALNDAWQVTNNAKSTIIMDFNLRKSIAYDNSGAESNYKFVADNELKSAVRVVNEANTGTVKGSYEDSNSGSEKIIVYAYKKGTFNAETETTPQGESGILFANAVSSTEVESGVTGKSFTLAFLEDGEYELIFAGYNRDTSGKLSFNATLDSEIDGSVGNLIEVESGTTLNISALVGIF